MADKRQSVDEAKPPGSEKRKSLEAAPEVPETLKKIFQYVDTNKDKYIGNLREAVGIRSVSAWPEARSEVIRMVTWTGCKLRDLQFQVEIRKIGEQTFPDGTTLALPPVIFATLGSDPNKKTVLIYGHLDVQPAKREDGWDSDPFLLSECHGMLFGRGSTDDKGPVLGWLHAVEAYQTLGVDIPVNIKMVLEAMEESGSEGLDDLLKAQKDKFLKDVDLVCISDNYWLGKNKPCLTYGLRGLSYLFLEVEGGTKDLHSGVFGGAVKEPMSDLVWLLAQLQDADGNILIPGILDDVCEVTSDEQELYDSIDFNVEAFREEVGVCELRFPNDKVKTLMHRWRYPSLSIHGIQGCFSDPGAKTVIPRKVIGKFSIRLVPNQTPDQVEKQVIAYINEKWAARKSPNTMRIYSEHGGKPWMADPNHPNFTAARIATKYVYNEDPLLIREGGSIPVTLTLQIYLADDAIPSWTTNPSHPSYKAARLAIYHVFHSYPDMIREGGYMNQVLILQETTNKNVLLLPMGQADDGAHSQNEKIGIRNYIEGTKVMAAYLYELGKITDSLQEDKSGVKCPV